MIKLPVRCEQDSMTSIQIKDHDDQVIAELFYRGLSSRIPPELWANAKQIVRALNTGYRQPKKEPKRLTPIVTPATQLLRDMDLEKGEEPK